MQPEKKKGVVLVVDDTPANLSVITAMLNHGGYEVRPAINGEVALRALAAKLPDLVLLDINMPGIKGYEVCRRIKADARTQHIPVIFLSAADNLEDKVEAFRVGGVDYVTKPFQVEEVMARVNSQVMLAQQRQKIETLMSFKDELLRTVSHDLKNPLHNIMGYTDMLMENIQAGAVDIADSLAIVERIRRSSDVMYHLVVTLLDLDRLEGGIRLEIRPTSLNQLLEDVFGQHQLAAENKRITLEMQQHDAAYVVPVDPARFAQALSNLVSNAIKYTPEGGNVAVVFGHQDNKIIIRIMDTGYGIPEDALPNLFKKFYRVNTVQHRREEGTGLGLSIVKAIVDLHGGDITVESEPGKGSVFNVVLPLP